MPHRVNGWPLYILGSAIGLILDRLNNPNCQADELLRVLTQAKPSIETFLNETVSFSLSDARITAQNVLNLMRSLIDEPDPPDAAQKKASLNYAIMQLNTMLARDLFWFDVYWIAPKLGFNTTALLTDATVIFPASIRNALPAPVKHEVSQAAACLLYEVPSAVGFHVLRAIEIVILDYFTIPSWNRGGANTWATYAKVLRQHRVHRKIIAMIERLATIHRNELMHAEAVLSTEEAAILFALMQEVLPIMIADIANRKGSPIADFPILNDPRWQS